MILKVREKKRNGGRNGETVEALWVGVTADWQHFEC